MIGHYGAPAEWTYKPGYRVLRAITGVLTGGVSEIGFTRVERAKGQAIQDPVRYSPFAADGTLPSPAAKSYGPAPDLDMITNRALSYQPQALPAATQLTPPGYLPEDEAQATTGRRNTVVAIVVGVVVAGGLYYYAKQRKAAKPSRMYAEDDS